MRLLALSFLLATALVSTAQAAAWVPDGIPVGGTAGYQWFKALVPDDAGGCYVAFEKLIPPEQIPTQKVLRLTASGLPASGWPSEGITLPYTVPGTWSEANIVADGLGGLFVVRFESTNRVRLLRIASNGATSPGWPDDGIVVRDQVVGWNSPRFIGASLDGGGGVYLLWWDAPCSYYNQHGGYCETWASRYTLTRVTADAEVATGWPDLGANVRDEQYVLPGRDLAPRSSGGVLISDADGYGSSFYLHGFDPAGQELFTRTVPSGGYLGYVIGAGDGSGGMYVAWHNYVESSGHLLRVGSDGLPLPGWPAAGIAFPGGALLPIADGSLLTTWTDEATTTPRALRLGGDGTVHPSWPADGLVLADGSSRRLMNARARDASDGMLVAFTDADAANADDFLWLQHVTGSAVLDPAWADDGTVPLCLASGPRYGMALISDGAGGAYAAWEDRRDEATQQNDVYVQHLNAQGQVYDVSVATLFERAWTEPVPGAVRLRWIVPDGAAFSEFEIHRGADGSAPAAIARIAANGSRQFDYTDATATTGHRYAYRILGRSASGDAWSDELAVDLTGAVSALAIAPVTPNPSRGHVDLTIESPHRGPLEVGVFDLAGRKTATLFTGAVTPGRRSVAWDGLDRSGARAPAGIYLVRVSHGGETVTRRIALTP